MSRLQAMFGPSSGPRCVALLLADDVRLDQSNAAIVTGVRQVHTVEQFPAPIRIAIFCAYVGVAEPVLVELSMSGPGADGPLIHNLPYRAGEARNPREQYTAYINVPVSIFQEPGEYFLRLRCGGQMIGETPFFVGPRELAQPLGY